VEQTNVILDVKNLVTRFKRDGGYNTAVNDISFQVYQGEFLGIVGESGCGKSVTSLSIMGLVEKPGEVSAESIRFEEKELTSLNKREMRRLLGSRISMIFQEPLTSLNPLFTVGNQIFESIRIHQRVTKKEAKSRVIEMLKKVNIPRAEEVYHEYPNALSGGMRQRIMIAMALSCNPKLLIADEPTTALDVTIQAQILALMKNLMHEFNTSIMFITHDLGVVAEIADRVIVMYAGEIVEEADVFTLFKCPMHPYTRGLLESTIRIDQDAGSLKSIEGTVPAPDRMPEGCRFHPRCALADPRCSLEKQPLVEAVPGHKVRCGRHEAVSNG
jgi:peptide/nickel transport system ATP-binding protein/oligopeptide transport system ATP-binding protein